MVGIMRHLRKVSLGSLREQKGIILVEIVLVVALLGIIGVSFAAALWTISNNTGMYDERMTASVLAQSLAEEIKATAYRSAGDYLLSVATPAGYNFSLSAAEVAANKQRITVAVTHDGKGIIRLETIKTNW